MLSYYLILSLVPFIALCDDDTSCNRPIALVTYEEECKTDPEVTGNNGSFLEQIQENIAAAMEQTKKLFNMARKRLGIKVNEEESDEKTKKCEYYQCLFRKMESLGANSYPNMSLVENWVNSNVDESIKEMTLVKVSSCFQALAMNIAIDIASSVIKEEGTIKIIVPMDDTNGTDPMGMALEDPTQVKSACDSSAKLMMCLNTDMMCTVFKYP